MKATARPPALRVAQIAPLVESVPPQMYCGTECVISALTEELVAVGLDVTLFASGDSTTSARLLECAPKSLRLDGKIRDCVALTTIQLAEVFRQHDDFDLIHNHIDYFAFPFARESRTPVITTAHGRLDLKEITNVYDIFSDAPLVSISNAQRNPLTAAQRVDTVYNGLDFSSFNLHEKPGTYLLFLGRISPEKRPDRAIEIARALVVPLNWRRKWTPRTATILNTLFGRNCATRWLSSSGKWVTRKRARSSAKRSRTSSRSIGRSRSGLTMVEAMACGTPVLATNVGSVPEVVEDGVSGFVCKSIIEIIQAVARVVQAGPQAASRIGTQPLLGGNYGQAISGGLCTPAVFAGSCARHPPSYRSAEDNR